MDAMDFCPQDQGRRHDKRNICLPHDRAECDCGADPCQGHAGHFDDATEIEQWMTAPAADALKLQRPLPDAMLRVVARGQRQDGAPAIA